MKKSSHETGKNSKYTKSNATENYLKKQLEYSFQNAIFPKKNERESL